MAERGERAGAGGWGKSRESCAALSRGRGPPCSALRCSEPAAAPSGGGRGAARRPPVSGRRPPGAGQGGTRWGRGDPPLPAPAAAGPPESAGSALSPRCGCEAFPGPRPGARPLAVPSLSPPQPGRSCPVEAGGACSAGLCSAACAGRGFRGKKINKKGWLPVEAARRVFLRGNSQNRAVWWWQLWACTGCSCVSTAKRGPRGSWSLGKFRAWRCDPWRRRKALGCLCVF